LASALGATNWRNRRIFGVAVPSLDPEAPVDPLDQSRIVTNMIATAIRGDNP
jgi:hypothetical protein